MKIGSLVVCVDASNLQATHLPLVKDRIYTVREVVKYSDGVGLLLEEIVNRYHRIENKEFCYKIERFRELDSPTEINIEEILKLELCEK